MKIDSEKFGCMAKVAMIELGHEEAEAQRRDLERIATYTEKLGELDTEGVSGMVSPFDAACHLREDEVANEDRTEELLAGAPDSKGPYFRVPRTIEE